MALGGLAAGVASGDRGRVPATTGVGRLLSHAGVHHGALGGASRRGRHVAICHATGSRSHPYVAVVASARGVLRGHVGRRHQGGEDIVPPFGSFPGQNWDATGRAIHANGCVVSEAVAIPGGATGIVAFTALVAVALLVSQRRRGRTGARPA